MARPARRLFHPLGWVQLRAPLLPVQAFVELGQPGGPGPRWPSGDGDAGAGADLAQMALQVGGGHLAQAEERSPCSADLAPKRLRYRIRMSTRPTPYGAFAGVALCRVAEATHLAIDPRRHVRHARPDMEWLLSFVDALEQRDEVLCQLALCAHPLLRLERGRVVLDDPSALRENAPPVSVLASQAVQAALERVPAPVPHDELVAMLVQTQGGQGGQGGQCGQGGDTAKARALVRELVELGLLLTDLRPPMTGLPPALHLLARLRAMARPPAETEALAAALAALERWSALPPAQAAREWAAVDAMLQALHAGPKTRIQVDLALGMTAQAVGRPLADDAAAAAELLMRLSPLPHGPPALEAWRTAFVARYGRERRVPLSELLDPANGLGLPGAGAASNVDARRLARRHATLQHLAQAALAEWREEVELDDGLIEKLALADLRPETTPASMDVSLFVAAASQEAVARGAYRAIVGPNVGARQAGRHLGRFAAMLGEPALEALRAVAAAEREHAPAAIWAESVYLPKRLRSANVAQRLPVRTHEVALGVPAGVATEQALAPDTLSVGVADGRLRLYQGEREVRINAGHMLTPLHAPRLSRFLEELGQDGVAQLSGFDWGPAAQSLYLPRVVRGRLVLACAQWRLSLAVLGCEGTPDGASFARALGAHRERWHLPRWVYMVEGDNRLMLDLDVAEQADQIRLELLHRGDLASVVLHEALPGPRDTWVPTEGGLALVELVVPVVRRTTHAGPGYAAVAVAAPTAAPLAAGGLLSQWRPPGTDWLFLKLYGEAAREAALLAGPVRTFCDEQRRAGRCDAWFFIRYVDPEPHLRIRLRGDPNRLLRELLPQVCEWAGGLMASDQITRFGFETYERELARYGGPAGMAWAEAFFAADSDSVVRLLAALAAGAEVDRLALLAISVDGLLADLGLDAAQRLGWYRQQVAHRQAGGSEYRERKAPLRAWFAPAERVGHWPAAIVQLVEARGSALRPLGQRLAQLQQEGRLSASRDHLLASFVHMHCNRYAGVDHGAETAVIGMLARLHEGLARAPAPAAVAAAAVAAGAPAARAPDAATAAPAD